MSVELKELIKKDPFGQMVVRVERQGVNFLLPWSSDTVVTPDLIEAVLVDMGVTGEGSSESPEAQKAAAQFCLKTLQAGPGYSQIMVSELQCLMWAFLDGYNWIRKN